jgi:signal transduction histidine kinase
MLEKTISELEQRIAKADSISGAERAALVKLIGQLKSEIMVLSKTNEEQANSIAGFTQVAANEAMRQERNAGLFKIAQEGLEKSVEEFEVTHPTLVNTIREISDVLSNLGI